MKNKKCDTIHGNSPACAVSPPKIRSYWSFWYQSQAMLEHSSILLQFRFRFIKHLIQLTKELYLVVLWKSLETNQWLAYDLEKTKISRQSCSLWKYLPLQLPFSMARSFAVFSLWFLRLRSELLSSNALATLTWSETCIIYECKTWIFV